MWAKLAEYVAEHHNDILIQLRDHICISLASLVTASVIGIVCGYYASKTDRWERLVTGSFEVLRVVPSLALLVLLIPVMGTGFAPAVTALTVLAVPPVLLNTIVGFQNVPAFLIESAQGIGMDPKQILWKVRVPQAMPMILAGVRTALVEVVASAALAARIGGGGLGEIIFTGLGLNRRDMLLLGGALVAALSLGSGFLFDFIRRICLPYTGK